MTDVARVSVLVVDDSFDTREMLAYWLTQLGYVVTTADGADSALQAIAERPPDMILMDVVMPYVDGFELCRRLKRDRSTRHIPVVLMSGLQHPENMRYGHEIGAAAFLVKPFDEDSLVGLVAALTGSAGAAAAM